MRVVDTSAWIEWLAQTRVGQHLNEHFPPREPQIVPTIIQLELAYWLSRETSERKAASVLADTERRLVVPLNTRIALRAAEFRRAHGMATADAIIYATASVSGADLLTCDAHFQGLPNVVYVAKNAA